MTTVASSLTTLVATLLLVTSAWADVDPAAKKNGLTKGADSDRPELRELRQRVAQK